MSKIEKSPLRSLYWKDEILQILYWMQGEGLGSEVPITQILSLLNTNEENLMYHIGNLVNDNTLLSSSDTICQYTKISLSSEIHKEAGRRFAEAFQGYQKAGHGECGPDCEFCYGADGEKLENCVHNCASTH